MLDALGSDVVVAGGHHQGGAASALFAATEPDRVRAFVWEYPDARSLWAPDYPWGVSTEYLERAERVTEAHWGTDALFTLSWALADEVVPTEASIGIGKLSRYTATPDVALEMDRIWNETDIRGVLPAVRAPALLIDDDSGDGSQIDYIASLMPNAQVVRFPGEDGFEPEYIDRLHEATGASWGWLSGRQAVTASCPRCCSPTSWIPRASRRARRLRLEAAPGRPRRASRSEIERFGGRYVHTTGDGLLATFDGPARAVPLRARDRGRGSIARPRHPGGLSYR